MNRNAKAEKASSHRVEHSLHRMFAHNSKRRKVADVSFERTNEVQAVKSAKKF